MGLEKILEMIRKQQDETGLKIRHNMFTLGSDVVETATGKVVHSGDAVSCQVYINQRQSQIKETKQ